MIDQRYPIGRFHRPDSVGGTERNAAISRIEAAPRAFRGAVEGLDESQLDTAYRDGGWTVRQLAHHMPDSHCNAYVRFKLALTEEKPTIRPYDEARWAELPDTRLTPIEVSLVMLESVHTRWVALLRGLEPAQFASMLIHPESGEWTLEQFLTLYAWHGDHHTAHITALRERMGWR